MSSHFEKWEKKKDQKKKKKKRKKKIKEGKGMYKDVG